MMAWRKVSVRAVPRARLPVLKEAAGRTAAILELAKAMKSNGRPIAQIAADTGLTVEEIESL